MQNHLVGVAFEASRQHPEFDKQLIGVARCTYACIQTCEVEVYFTTK